MLHKKPALLPVRGKRLRCGSCDRGRYSKKQARDAHARTAGLIMTPKTKEGRKDPPVIGQPCGEYACACFHCW